MNLKGISHYLGLSCYPIAFLSFFNILYSSYLDHYLNFDSYIITLAVSLAFAFFFIFLVKIVIKILSFTSS